MTNKTGKKTVKLSDYVARYLVEHGVKYVFMIPGGGAMHLNDSVGKCHGLKYICNHHEQASAIGAEGYSRVSGKIGVAVVTSGPGGTNTLTGLAGQWLDSIPTLYISGQLKTETCIASYPGSGLRQLGDQELNITDVVRPITKFSYLLYDPAKIRWALDKAVYLATHGRPGPAWIDIPLNIQAAQVCEADLVGYEGDETPINAAKVGKWAKDTARLIRAAKRPVVLAGHGIRLAGAESPFEKLTARLKAPLLATFAGFDLVPNNNPLYAGRIGTIGTRAGNFALQSADLVISLGSRNNIRQVSYDWANYARHAKKVVVDIDPAELKKPTLIPDIAVNADVGVFMSALLKELGPRALPDFSGWLKWCRDRVKRYPQVLPEYKRLKKLVNPYYFVETLTGMLNAGTPVVAGNGSACVCLFQAGIVKKGQRAFWNSGCATMGYDLPAAIGVSLARNRGRVVCLAGDGSVMMNFQELATIAYQKLPIKIFILNNDGYISMKQTQDSFFEGCRVACDPGSGIGFPDFIKVGKALGLKTAVISKNSHMAGRIAEVLSAKGPVLCEVRLPADYKFVPKLSSDKLPDGTLVSKPLEDMWPFLEKSELSSNTLV